MLSCHFFFRLKVNPLKAKSLSVTETRRLLAFGRPFINHMGGEIFFDAKGYFYYTSGEGKQEGKGTGKGGGRGRGPR